MRIVGTISRATSQGVAMSFLAGYVDTVGFVALFGLFTAHVTGNFVLIGSELANPSHGVLIKFLAFPAFIGSVILTRMAVIWLGRGGDGCAERRSALDFAAIGANYGHDRQRHATGDRRRGYRAGCSRSERAPALRQVLLAHHRLWCGRNRRRVRLSLCLVSGLVAACSDPGGNDLGGISGTKVGSGNVFNPIMSAWVEFGHQK